MASLKANGIELLRAIRISREGSGSSGAFISFRETFSIRSNGAIMQKRDHVWSDDQDPSKWRSGKWKRAKKIPAQKWRKLDHDRWIERQREILINGGYEIQTEQAETDRALRSLRYMIGAGNDQRGRK